MSDASIDINLNDNSGFDGSNPPVNPAGETAQDKNFDKLVGEGAFRPDAFPAMPELLNVMSILADSNTAIRKLFLPLRKLFQIMAKSERGEQPSAQLANRNGDFTPKESKTEKEALMDSIRQQVADMGYPTIEPKPTPKMQGGPKSAIGADVGANLEKKMMNIFGARGKGIASMMTNTSNYLQTNFLKIAGVATGVATGLVVFSTALAGTAAVIYALNSVIGSTIDFIKDISPQVIVANSMAEMKRLRAAQDINRKVGSQVASIIGEKADLEVTMAKFGAKITSSFAPLMQGLVAVGTSVVRFISSIYGILEPFIMGLMSIVYVILEIVAMILDILSMILETIMYPAELLLDALKKWLMPEGEDGESLDGILKILGISLEDFDKRAKTLKPWSRPPKLKF